MTDKVKEVYNSLQERLKSPFILTFIIVWSIKHWRLILIVLNFKDTENVSSKQEQIENYIKGHSMSFFKYELPNWVGMVLPVLLWSLISIITYYLITILTDSISIYYKRLKSNAMVKLNEKRAVVTKEEYDIEVSKANRLQVRNENLTKRLSEVEIKYTAEKREIDSLMESVNSELLSSKADNKILKEQNTAFKNDLLKRDTEIEKLNNNFKSYSDEIRLFEHKSGVLENRISKRNTKILELINLINTSNDLDELKKVVSNENLIDIDTKKSNIEIEHSTKTSIEASQILKEVFGFDRWQFTAYYPNDKIIKEKFRLHNNYFLLDTGEKIFIDNVFLDKENHTIRFTKLNMDSRYSYDELETKLEIKDKNELKGIEPDNVNVTYKRL